MTVATTEGGRSVTTVSSATPQPVSALVQGVTAPHTVLAEDEALKEATQAGVAERWARIEERTAFGCVDWYLYPEERRPGSHPSP